MCQGKWSRLSSTQRADIWTRWKAGQTLHDIGRAYGKPHPTIRKVLLPRGGIPPIARRRSRLALTLAEREDISRGIASGSSIREIASRLDRAASTGAGRSPATAAVLPIVPMMQIAKPGTQRCDRNAVCLP